MQLVQMKFMFSPELSETETFLETLLSLQNLQLIHGFIYAKPIYATLS